MRNTRITCDYIKTNFKANKKVISIALILSVFLGVVVGSIDMITYENNMEDRPLSREALLELEGVSKDGAYYYNAFLNLKQKNEYLNGYLKYLKYVELSEENVEQLRELEEKLQNIQPMIEAAEYFYINNPPAYTSHIDDSISFYLNEIESLKAIDSDNELELKALMDGSFSDAYKTSKEEEILESKKYIKKNIEMLDFHVEYLTYESQDSVRDNANKADIILNECYSDLNNLIRQFNDILNSIYTVDNYELVFNKSLIEDYYEEIGMCNKLDEEKLLETQKDKAIIYAKSMAGLDIPKERFLATVTFFALFGTVITVLVGMLYRKDK